MLVAKVVPQVIAFPGQGQKRGHDVGHHPVDVEGEAIFGNRGLWPLHFGDDHRGGFTGIALQPA